MMVDVPDVELELLLPSNRISPVDLRPSGDSGFYIMTARLPEGIERKVFHQQRTRADKTQIASDDIDQLRQFVDAELSQPLSEGRQSRGIIQQIALSVALFGHRAKFV